jgi:hypothetical protein
VGKQGDALSPLLSNFTLDYAINRMQVNQEGLIVNGTHKLIIYANDAYMLAGSIYAVKKQRFVLVASRSPV